MKSIRLSLMVYFLGLLALALGVASWYVSRTAAATLQDKQRTTEQFVEKQYEARRLAEEQRLDRQLEHEAEGLLEQARFQIDQSRFRLSTLNRLNVTGLVASQATPNAVLVPLWLAGATPPPPRTPGPRPPGGEQRPLSSEIYRRYYDTIFRQPPALEFKEDDLRGEAETPIGVYFQVHTTWGVVYRSHLLESEDEWLPLDVSRLEKDSVQNMWRDEVTLDNSETTVRRAVLKVPLARFGFGLPRAPAGRGGSPPGPSGPDSPQRLSSFYIQCAYNIAERGAKFGEIEAQRQSELEAVRTETGEALSRLRKHLFFMSAATFAATVAGTWFLVRLGLMPLRRLGDAVSRVSEKDFRLQFDEPRLPVELRPIVERLTNTLEQLKRAFAREKQATADISHELRTPLAALLTTTELALRKPRSAEEYRELLEDCRHSGRQMNRAVERLLALARLDAGVDTLRPERVDVAALAEQCAALVRPLAEARGLQLRVHGGDGAELLADPDKLREVLTNLLHNAIEYNRPQGHVDVSVVRENGHLCVEVRDTGIGIAPELREHIFERFYRADPSRGAGGLHAGLGLAIVKGYVDLMGGTIRVESVKGQGSTFHVELPATAG